MNCLLSLIIGTFFFYVLQKGFMDVGLSKRYFLLTSIVSKYSNLFYYILTCKRFVN